jgi:hypothetical protein
MTTRDRWTVYPLLFLAIGLGLTACIQGQADHAAFEGQLVHSKKFEGDIVLCKELVVVNDSGKPVVQVTANKTGAGLVQTASGDGTFQAGLEGQLVRSKEFNGAVVLCKELVVVNDSGKPVVEVAANEKSGAGILQARNGNGTVQAVLSAEPPGGVLRMLDTTGKFFQFPSIERRPFPLLPAGDANPSEEQPAAKDDKAEK